MFTVSARLNNRCTYPRGKALGGSSSINDMLCFRGNSFDYDSWFAAGNEGWSYEEVLPYFKKLETAHFEGDEKYRGKNGPIKVKYPKATIPSLENFIEANMALGRDVVDFNAAKQIGVGRNQFTIDNGQRESGGSVFIKRAGCRDTLKILQNALVTKVVLNEKKEAVGVEFVKKGSVFIARANREVILSAGAVNTPQILMLSGIGPKEELEPVGIVPIVELQGVGRNLDDHVIFLGLSFTSNISALPSKPLRQEVKEYLSGYGPLTLPKTSYATTFLKVKTSPLPQDVPDIQLIFIPFTCKQQPEEPEKTCFNIYPILLHPKSKGTISLASDSPIHYPIINTNTLFEASDRQIVYEGIQAVLDLITTEPLQKINATYIKSSIPECDAFKLFSENYWMCNLEYLSAPSFHTTSTARMGSEEDSVVDNRLRVKGVKNLRIVDASVMPSVTSGPTNLPTFMIAARAADFIREDQITRV